MKNKQNPERLALVMQLAEMLGVDLKDSSLVIATDGKPVKVRVQDGALEATVTSADRPQVRIESLRAPGIYIEMVNHQRDSAPEGAIYRISAYMPQPIDPSGVALNGDVYEVYVGRNGIILDNAARERAARLYQKER